MKDWEKISVAAAIVGSGAATYFLLKKKKTTTTVRKCGNGEIYVDGQCVAATISLSASSTTIEVGQSDTITATITDINGQPIQGVTVTFSDSSGTLGSAETDSSGNASISLTFNEAGTYTITASA